MRLVDTAIKRPVSVIVGVLFIALFGLISLFRIPVQLTPDVDRPIITVSTVWPGASPEEVEQEIVQRQEEQLKSVEGLVLMTSESNDSRGVVTLEFNVGVDPDAVLLLVSNKLDQVFGYPLDAERPVISAGGSGPSGAITWIMLEPLPDRDDLDIERYRDYGEEVVKTALERVPGVSRSDIYGGYDRQLQVIVDPQAMAARQITVQDLAQALTRENANTSAGTFDEGKRRYIVRTVGQYQQPSDIEQVVVRSADGTRVTVGEIARTRLGYVRTVASVRQKGRPAIAVNAQRETGANVLEVMDGIRRTIRELNEGPLAREGLHLTQVYDETNYIDSAINLVRSNIIIGGTLAVTVLFIFLRSVSSVAIIATSIPISIVGTFLAMWLLGRNINVISLAGMSFAVGMVIDNAIVALENIFRHQQMGKTRVRAALDGASEVWGALLASTLTTVAIFLPIVFVQDEAGQLFRDIAIAVSCSVVLSLIVAISVIPSLANKILGGDKPRGDVLAAWGDRARNFIAQSVFRISGSTVLRLGVITGLIGLSLVIAWTLLPKSEYLPTGNRNLIFGIVLPPPGYNLDELIQVGQTIEDVLRASLGGGRSPR